MNNIVTLLPKLIDMAGDNPEFIESVAKTAWSRAVGEGLRLHTLPLCLSGKTLRVAVADATWQRQLQAMSAELLARVNRVLGRNLIDFIEFRIEPNNPEIGRGDMHQGRPTPNLDSVPAEIILAAESIKDQTLRQHFLYAAAASRRD
jgi:hypothetical protein